MTRRLPTSRAERENTEMTANITPRDQAVTALVAHNNALRLAERPNDFRGRAGERNMQFAVACDLSTYRDMADDDLIALAQEVGRAA